VPRQCTEFFLTPANYLYMSLVSHVRAILQSCTFRKLLSCKSNAPIRKRRRIVDTRERMYLRRMCVYWFVSSPPPLTPHHLPRLPSATPRPTSKVHRCVDVGTLPLLEREKAHDREGGGERAERVVDSAFILYPRRVLVYYEKGNIIG
jgi:hypothetical protein